MDDRIAHNLSQLRQRIGVAAERAGRNAEAVKLVAVTKTVSLAEVLALYELGVRDFGENRLESARAKIAEAPADICWHHIAPVQTRKAPDIVRLFSVADAIERVKAAKALQRRCEEQDTTLEILIEVNVSGEEAKHGFTPETLSEALNEIVSLDRLQATGLMTMAPLEAPEPLLRTCFRTLRQLCEENGLPECSMGMTDDFEIAVEEGSTQVRVGRALFV